MNQKDDLETHNRRPTSPVSEAFLENRTFLKRFLTRFFSDHQDVEDVAQETYLRAYVAEQQKEIEQPKAYLFRIARNLALTQLTKKSTKITDYLEECGASMVIEYAAPADSEAEALETLGLYCEAVASLPEKCRQVFLFRKVHGLAHKEIAERMALSVSSVEKYLLRGVLECKAYVREREGRMSGRKTSTVVESGHSKGRQ